MSKRRVTNVLLPGLIGLGAIAAATVPASIASAATPKSVVVNGHCSGTSLDNLQLQREDTGKLSIDFGVDMARHVKGVPWTVTETDNGTVIVNTTVHTIRDGSFSITRVVLPKAGTNTVVGKATNPVTGESCSISASI